MAFLGERANFWLVFFLALLIMSLNWAEGFDVSYGALADRNFLGPSDRPRNGRSDHALSMMNR